MTLGSTWGGGLGLLTHLCHGQGWLLQHSDGVAVLRSWVAPLGLEGTTGLTGYLGTCQDVLLRPDALHGGCRPGEHGWGKENLWKCSLTPGKKLPPPSKFPADLWGLLCSVCPLSWAKLSHVTTLHMSCSVQKEQNWSIKGTPRWGKREWVEGWSVNQLSGILAF